MMVGRRRWPPPIPGTVTALCRGRRSLHPPRGQGPLRAGSLRPLPPSGVRGSIPGASQSHSSNVWARIARMPPPAPAISHGVETEDGGLSRQEAPHGRGGARAVKLKALIQERLVTGRRDGKDRSRSAPLGQERLGVCSKAQGGPNEQSRVVAGARKQARHGGRLVELGPNVDSGSLSRMAQTERSDNVIGTTERPKSQLQRRVWFPLEMHTITICREYDDYHQFSAKSSRITFIGTGFGPNQRRSKDRTSHRSLWPR